MANGQSELRKRFCDYMVLRGFSPNTQEAYLYAVVGLVRHTRRSPDQLSQDEVRAYLLYLIQERKLSDNTCRQIYSALRVFYREVVGWAETEFSIPPRVRQTLRPEVLSVEEVTRLLDAARPLKHRVLLMATYSAGLRVGEVARLKPTDIESDRMLIRVEQAKGKKDRYTILSERLLEELRLYWRAYRPEGWLFPGRPETDPLSIDSAQRIYKRAKKRAGIVHGRGIHTLRHSFATHLLDEGVDVLTIKEWMGHSSLRTTAGYVHVSVNRRRSVKSPLDTLPLSPDS